MNNQISPTRFDRVALNILNLIPLPLGPNANSGQPSANYQRGWNSVLNTYLPSIKLDHQLGTKSHISAYISSLRYSSP